MTADALPALLALQGALTEADAYACITAAILAGLSGPDAQAAMDQWNQARSVQVIGSCRCCVSDNNERRTL